MNFAADAPEWNCVSRKRTHRCEILRGDEMGKVKDILDLSILCILHTVIYHRNIEKLQNSFR